MFGLNFSERYIVALNFLLVGIIVYFLANSVVDVMHLRLAGSVVPEVSETLGARGESANLVRILPRSGYDAIVRRDIFNLTPLPETAPVETAQNLQIKLIGTSHLSAGKPFVIVEDDTGSQSLYRLGDEIPNAGRLMEVGKDRAIILHNGRRLALVIPHEDEADTGLKPFPPSQSRRRRLNNPMIRRPGMPFGRPNRPGAGVRRLGTNRYVVDRSTVDGNLRNMPKLFTEMRAVPNLENGTSNGFRLSEIQPGSFFQQIGLQDGDILTAVSGQQMSDPVKALALLQTLRSSSSLTVSVLRNGAPMQLYYHIR